ncbi:MAG: reverse transcriptase family protein [Bacilli bacterium]|nr:reverse transcriptase family protein [Patescibacteria group bacterium]
MKKRKLLNINTISELSRQIGLPEEFLLRVSENINNYYEKFEARDKKGKERSFYSANNDLKKIHKSINRLLDSLDYPINIQGGITKRSIVTNASMHVGKKYVANYDIKNFFPSVNYRIVYKAFRRQKCAPDVSRILTMLTTADGCLPQGFATSPKISGLVLYNANFRIEKLLRPFGLVHTFWIDDLTISGHHPIKKFQKLLYKIFKQEGFSLHDDPKKAKITDSKHRQTCTGLIINQELNPERGLKSKVRKEIYLCKKFGIKNFLEEHNSPFDKDTYLKKLAGNISFLCNVNKKNIIFKKELELLK